MGIGVLYLLKGNMLHLVVGSVGVDDVVVDGSLLGPLVIHGVLQHQMGLLKY